MDKGKTMNKFAAAGVGSMFTMAMVVRLRAEL